MPRRAKLTKPKVDAKPAISREVLKSEGSRVHDLDRHLAEALKREAEALEQQRATAEILRVMSSSLAVKKQEVVHPGRPGESSGCQVITHPRQEAWMNVHKNARLTLRRRQELVTRREAGAPLKRVARSFDVSVRTARKWWRRYQIEGAAGLQDRSSRPHVSP